MPTKHRFVHRNGWVYVTAPDEATARTILASHAHNRKDPGWLYCGTREYGRQSDLERLEKWLLLNSSA